MALDGKSLVAAGAVVVALVAGIFLLRPGPEPEAAPGTVAVAPLPEVPLSVAEAPEPVVEAPGGAPGEATSQEPAPEEPATGTAMDIEPDPELPTEPVAAPSFDVVRVEPDGSALVAGRAAPGETVTIELDGVAVGAAEADAGGSFVALLDLGTSEAPRAMRLVTGEEGDAPGSDQTVILGPSPEAASGPAGEASAEAPVEAEPVAEAAPEEAAGETAEAAPAGIAAEADVTAAEPAEAPEETAADDASPPPSEVADDAIALTETTGEEPQPQAPAVLLSDAEGVRVLQSGETAIPDAVSVDAISYDETGAVFLSGRATGAGSVRVYLNNAPVLTDRDRRGRAVAHANCPMSIPASTRCAWTRSPRTAASPRAWRRRSSASRCS
jgi:hypothetical protein